MLYLKTRPSSSHDFRIPFNAIILCSYRHDFLFIVSFYRYTIYEIFTQYLFLCSENMSGALLTTFIKYWILLFCSYMFVKIKFGYLTSGLGSLKAVTSYTSLKYVQYPNIYGKTLQQENCCNLYGKYLYCTRY